MSAKPSRKKATKAETSPALPASATGPRADVTAPVSATGAAAVVDTPAWIDSSDPRKRLIGKIVLAGVWIYVAALWLLALDQTFHWGIFGPKVPPVP